MYSRLFLSASINPTQLLNEMTKVGEELQKLEAEQKNVEETFSRLVYTVPNLVHESVPIGEDEKANQEIRSWGNPPKFDFKIKDHIDLSYEKDLVDLERAAKVSGARFYYLKNELVRLNQALINYALDFLAGKNYSLVQPPYLISIS